jgi:triosephosphate isomerase (TIM)
VSAPWPRRPRLVAGNWKMHKTAAEGAVLARELLELMRARPRVEIAVCPPFTAIDAVRHVLRESGIHVGGQNVHRETHGPFTGEISAPMLESLGCRFAIVGHSERRHGMGEDDATVAKKLVAALAGGLTPIACVGETLAEREAGRTTSVLEHQVEAAYGALSGSDARATVVAYEPVWAIGTGKVATPDQACESHRVIRQTLDRVVGAGAGREIAILYGGSVNAGNAAAMFAEAEIDGALVGGASLEAASFWKIAVAAAAE